ncbi:MAG: hypothetical protein H6Q08_853 [Acidobacteria bacterium]|nr:hypothetical protein [Acidobacteriota bacterium]
MNSLLVGATLVVLATTTPPDDRATVECAFQHPRYVGTCVEKVTPEEDQSHLAACRVVLACLNDTRCVKTYCQATTIRGGWTLVSPKPESKQR